MAALISIVIVVLNTIAAILVVWGKTYDEGERLTPRGRWAVFCILVAAAIQIQRTVAVNIDGA
jgi:hypothetical protein